MFVLFPRQNSLETMQLYCQLLESLYSKITGCENISVTQTSADVLSLSVESEVADVVKQSEKQDNKSLAAIEAANEVLLHPVLSGAFLVGDVVCGGGEKDTSLSTDEMAGVVSEFLIKVLAMSAGQ